MTQADITSQILREVGDPNGTLRPIVGALWAMWEDRGQGNTTLVMLYAKRAAIDVRLAEEQSSTDFIVEQELSDKQSQRFAHLQQMREDTQAEIVRMEAVARATRVPRTGALTTTAPLTPPYPDYPDASDPVYSGSPYGRRIDW